MEKIKVRVCMGTACYVMGAGDFFFLKESLEPELASLVELEAVSCFNLCDRTDAKPPYVYVNDLLIVNARQEDVLKVIRTFAERKRRKPDEQKQQ